jgi:endonuclease I
LKVLVNKNWRLFIMKTSIFFILLIAVSYLFAVVPVGYYDSAMELTGSDLRLELHNIISENTNTSYTNSKKIMYSQIDNLNETVNCVYSGFSVAHSLGNQSTPTNIDCEHSYCQSWIDAELEGMENSIAKADIHHLFPTKSSVNIARSNNPFAHTQNINYTYSEDGGFTTSFLGQNSDGFTVFEVADQHKGDVARALLYFIVRYETALNFGNVDMLETLLNWHYNDPVSTKEIDRNDAIYNFQNNRNPFIDHPLFVDEIWNDNASITLTFPNESLILGTNRMYTIKWFSHYFFGNVRIELLNSVTNYFAELTDLTENDGEFEWEIPADLEANSNYSIRISDSENTTIYDNSNAYFTVVETNPQADIFISEYCEGSSYNKYIEIFNGTGAVIDFSKYSLKIYHNGNLTPTNTINFSNLLLNDDTFVIAHTSANSTILTNCNLTFGGINFNGDDAVALYKNDELIDIIGNIGEDLGVGWNVAGSQNATKDHTLVRKNQQSFGNVDWNISAGLNPQNSEWIVNNCDFFDSIGSHTLEIPLTTPHNVSFKIENSQIIIDWSPVTYANNYRVYSAPNLHSAFTLDESGIFNETSWTTSISGNKKFFKITAE